MRGAALAVPAYSYSLQFADAMRAVGLEPPDTLHDDGKIHRFASGGKSGDDAGWYVLHGDGIPAGRFGCWREGIDQPWKADIGRSWTPAEQSAHKARMHALQATRDAERVKVRSEAALQARTRYEAAQAAIDGHAYLVGKRIKAHGVKRDGGRLVIPMRAEGVIHSLQFIGPEGDKRFLTGGRVKGCYFPLGSVKDAAALYIAEGFATGATIHEITGQPVAVAFNAGNLEPVAKTLWAKYADLPIIVCADDDVNKKGNSGITKATAAARAVGGLLAIPAFGSDREGGMTDFNDMAAHCGREAVHTALQAATFPVIAEQHSGNESPLAETAKGLTWPVPGELVSTIERMDYPLDALPVSLLAVVNEVAGFVKCPVSMVACSALSALSMVIQPQADIKRAERLSGPVGLYMLTIAESGERKTTVDGFFTQSIKNYEAEQAALARPLVKQFEADLGIWEARRAGVREGIKQAAKTGKATQDLERVAHELEQNKPEAPRVPVLIMGDETPENLAHRLATKWPYGGVVSSEAGVIFGAHGMGKNSVMRALGLFNILWDGGELSIGRRSVESFTVRNTRFTLSLQIQEETLRSFFNESGALARGTGFMARFLIAWPESTQGFRPFTESPDKWPALAAFNQRMATLLAQPVDMDEHGELHPLMLTLTTETKTAWIAFHDNIEEELRSGGELQDIRDVASKAADNAVRLAALFQVFEYGGGAVGLQAFESAGRIVVWHLNESRRFLGELAMPKEQADAALLDKWLIDYCKRENTDTIQRRKVQQIGPRRLRGKVALDNALRELIEVGRVYLLEEGKRKSIVVNPALLSGNLSQGAKRPRYEIKRNDTKGQF